MKKRGPGLLLVLCLLIPATTSAQIRELERSIPEVEGVPSGALIALMDSLMGLPKTDIHSVMVLRHGKVIAEIYPEPFAPEYRHTVYSCSKTFVGAVKIIKLDMTGAIFIIVGVCYSYIFIIVKYAVYQLFQLNSLLELWLLASVKYHNILI